MPRFGVFLPSYVFPGEAPPAAPALQSYAHLTEEIGFDSIWVFDHLLEAPPSYRVAFLEPATTLALDAAATKRVTIGTGVLVLPLRDPVLTAKTFANIDLLSDGRLVFGVGVGWAEKEFQASQVGLSQRGRRMDEILDIILGLWTHDTFAYHGSCFTLRRYDCYQVRSKNHTRRFGLQAIPYRPEQALISRLGRITPLCRRFVGLPNEGKG